MGVAEEAYRVTGRIGVMCVDKVDLYDGYKLSFKLGEKRGWVWTYGWHQWRYSLFGWRQN